ncbi:hypothetical protein MD484_g1555, partial [Candolleomyces efflorescens]
MSSPTKRLRPEAKSTSPTGDVYMASPAKKTRQLESYGFRTVGVPDGDIKKEEDIGEIGEKERTKGIQKATDKQDGIAHLVLRHGFNQETYDDLSAITYEKTIRGLEHFHLDGRLMLKMKELPAYISGSFPLSITHPTVQANDLDLYVNRYKVDALVEFLVGEGYGTPSTLGKDKSGRSTTYKEDGGQASGEKTNCVLTMEHAKGGRINIVATEASPIQVIPLFHSTIVMNYITAHGFVMLYPKLTLRNIGMINHSGKLTSKLEDCIEKYRKRGFTLTRGYPSAVPKSHACGADKHCPQSIRDLQDREVMHIRFPPYTEVDAGEVRRKFDAHKCVWQLANGTFCRRKTADRHGFSMVNNYVSLMIKGEGGKEEE